MIRAGGLAIVDSWPSIRSKPFYYVKSVRAR
jgi:hypothetical protein